MYQILYCPSWGQSFGLDLVPCLPVYMNLECLSLYRKVFKKNRTWPISWRMIYNKYLLQFVHDMDHNAQLKSFVRWLAALSDHCESLDFNTSTVFLDAVDAFIYGGCKNSGHIEFDRNRYNYGVNCAKRYFSRSQICKTRWFVFAIIGDFFIDNRQTKLFQV